MTRFHFIVFVQSLLRYSLAGSYRRSINDLKGPKMAEKPVDSVLLGLTAQIVSAHAANNELGAGTLPAAIRVVYDTLANIGNAPPAPVEKAQPAVPIRKSVFPDYIICLEDGKRLKVLKRHLSTSYNMTPEQYRAKWGLDANYPMVAPNYAERRSELAKQIGLGTHRTSAR
jgi:predicted transcriptional regulator